MAHTPRWLTQLTEGLPRPFWALWGGTFITKAGAFVVPLLFLYLTQHRHLEPLAASGVVSLYGVGSFLGSLLGGVLADRLGRKVTMLGALVGGASFLLVVGLSTATWLLSVATFLMGLTADAYRPASQALVADLVAPAHRLKAFGLQYWAINLGFSLAAFVGGLLAVDHFAWLFVGDAGTTLVLALIVWRLVPGSPAVRPGGGTSGGSVLSPFLDRRYLAFLALTFPIVLVFFQHLTALPSVMAARGLSTRVFGAAVAVNGLLIVLVQPLATRLAGRIRRHRVLALAAALTGLGFGLTALAEDLPGYAASVAVWTLGEVFFAPVNAAIVADLSPEHLRGRYQGAYALTWAMGHVCAPFLGTALLPRVGQHAFWAACLGVGLAVAAAFSALGTRLVPEPLAARPSA